ncbi:hypothetical protein WJX72_007870 [[Myrmecia] bisecta]|uniref:Uncharacterized protein n=1 Tax=[Myrmecia] bisecta TaxID=41462 RepID=A0AAW1PU46_9CHLO
MQDLSDAEAHKQAGNILYGKGLWEQAAAKYTDALNACHTLQAPRNKAVYHANRAACWLHLDQPFMNKKALEDCTASQVADPTYVRPCLRRATIHENLGEWEPALEACDWVLELDPGNQAATEAVARIHQRRRQQREEAIAGGGLLTLTRKQYDKLMGYFCSGDCQMSYWERLVVRTALALHMGVTYNLAAILRTRLVHLAGHTLHHPLDQTPMEGMQLIDAHRLFITLRNPNPLVCAMGAMADLLTYEFAPDKSLLHRLPDRFLLHPEGKPFHPLPAQFIEERVKVGLREALGITVALADVPDYLRRSFGTISGMAEERWPTWSPAPSWSQRKAEDEFLTFYASLKLPWLQEAAFKMQAWGAEWPLHDNSLIADNPELVAKIHRQAVFECGRQWPEADRHEDHMDALRGCRILAGHMPYD